MRKTKIKSNKAITLIALVITIIVMLILVGVTITMAINGGLFGYAGEAASETEKAKQKELEWGNVESGKDYDYLIDKYTTEDYDEDGWKYAWTCTNGTWSDNIENTSSNLTGDVIAKLYERGTITIEGEEYPAYHLVIEKGNGTGEMGPVIAIGNKDKAIKVAEKSNYISDVDNRILLAALKEEYRYAWEIGLNSQITKVVIKDGVTSIGEKAFYRCINLKTIIIPNSVTSIGDEAFRKCSNLTRVNIPNSVTSIGNVAFMSCTNLTKVDISDGVETIGKNTFSYCSNLTSVNIPNSVTSIGELAFYGCSNLTNVNIPSSVISIGSNAFSSCTNLTDLNIPDSVEEIGSGAFYSVPHIEYHGTAEGAPWGALSMN